MTDLRLSGQCPKVWIISDKSGERQSILQKLGYATVHFHHDLHSKGHYNHMLQLLEQQRPILLWIRLAGPCAGTGNKRDSVRVQHLCSLAEAQRALAGMTVVEANCRSQSWNLQNVRSLLHNMYTSQHSWCSYENAADSASIPCNTAVQLATSFPLQSAGCRCSPGTLHKDSKKLGKDKDRRWESVLYQIVKTAVLSVVKGQQHRQPELKDFQPAGGVMANSITDRPVEAELLQPGSVQDLRLPNQVLQPGSVQDLRLPNQVVINIGSRNVSDVRGDNSQDTSCHISVSRPLKAERSIALSLEDGRSYPTEQALKRKAVIASGHKPKQRLRQVEQNDDDCGESLDSILPIVDALHWSSSLMSAEAECSDTEMEEYSACSMFAWGNGRWMHGSCARSPMASLSSRPIVSVTLLSNIHHELEQQNGRCVALMELFGGAAETSHLLVKLHGLKAGTNFDMTAGFDMSVKEDVTAMRRYVHEHEPLVILMGPPCKGFGPLQSLNRVIHPEAWKRARTEGEPLAELCAELAIFAVATRQALSNRAACDKHALRPAVLARCYQTSSMCLVSV